MLLSVKFELKKKNHMNQANCSLPSLKKARETHSLFRRLHSSNMAPGCESVENKRAKSEAEDKKDSKLSPSSSSSLSPSASPSSSASDTDEGQTQLSYTITPNVESSVQDTTANDIVKLQGEIKELESKVTKPKRAKSGKKQTKPAPTAQAPGPDPAVEDELSSTEGVAEGDLPTETPTKKRAKKSKPEPTKIATSDPNTTVVLKRKRRGPEPRKKTVIVYREDIQDATPKQQTQVVVKSRKRGRPKEIIEDDDEEGKGKELVVEEEKVIMRPTKTGKDKQLSARQLKKMELDQRFIEIEQAANRKLRQTRKGKVDQRCIGERTERQIAATKRMLEANRVRREKIAKEKNTELVNETLSVLTERNREQKKKRKKEQEDQTPPPPPPAPAPAPKPHTLADLFS